MAARFLTFRERVQRVLPPLTCFSGQSPTQEAKAEALHRNRSGTCSPPPRYTRASLRKPHVARRLRKNPATDQTCRIVRWRDRPRCVKICLMAGRECYHCKQWVDEREEHDCWRRRRQLLLGISPRTCGTPGTGCARPLLLSAISGFTPPINRSCSHGTSC
jgi:hypothetical protein